MSANPEGPPPAGVALDVDAAVVGDVRFGPDGLVATVVQDAHDGTIYTVAYMNEESLQRTLATGRSWFWSRSRQELWCKGETSGDRQYVRELRLDCDGDAVVMLVDQHGKGACHTGERTCFYRTLAEGPGVARADQPSPAGVPAGPGPGH